MNKRKRNQLEQNLISSLIAYRINQEIIIIEEELNALKELDEQERKGISKITEKLVGHPIRNQKEKKIEEDLFTAKNNLNNYVGGIEEGIDVSSYQDVNKLHKMIDILFDKDDGSAKMSLGLELALDTNIKDDVHLVREEKSLEALSILLFSDEKKLEKMREVYLYSFKRISSRAKIDEFSKGSIFGASLIAISMLIGRINPLLPLAMSGLTSILLLRKKKMSKNPDASLLLFSTLVASGQYKGQRKIAKINKILEQGKEIDSDSLIHSLVMGLTVYNFTFVDKDTREAKEALNNYLQLVDSLRGDAEYLSFVERINNKENYKKIEICNKVIELIDELVKLDIANKAKVEKTTLETVNA